MRWTSAVSYDYRVSRNNKPLTEPTIRFILKPVIEQPVIKMQHAIEYESTDCLFYRNALKRRTIERNHRRAMTLTLLSPVVLPSPFRDAL